MAGALSQLLGPHAEMAAEDAAGRSLFRGFGQLRPDAAPGGADGGVANTNVLFHGGRLLALEEGHLPIEIDPVTLATGAYQTMPAGSAGRSPPIRASTP
jgi:carotenoid cleavage dioxygenase